MSGHLDKIIVYGAGGHARVVVSAARQTGKFEVVCIVDPDGMGDPDEMIQGCFVETGGPEVLERLRRDRAGAAMVAFGDSQRRQRAFETLIDAGFHLPPLVHPSAIIDPTSEIGDGVQALALSHVGPSTIIGRGVILNTGCTVEHETTIGEFSTLSPSVSVAGRCTIGNHVFFGLGSNVADQLSVGQYTKVGAGAVVLESIPSHALAVGIPARVKR